MKVLLLTNMPSYHQMQFATALVAHLGLDNFRIAFFNPTSDSRSEMGWQDHYTQAFVLRYWQSDSAKTETKQWITNADVVIQGRFPIAYLRQRISAGKLTFAYQERYWKRPFSYLRVLFRLPRIIKNFWSVNKSNYHLLAAGAYAAADLNRIGVFCGRSWKFGYFINPCPAVVRNTNTNRISILWCARFSAVKQPFQAIKIAQGLKNRGLNFQLTMIGDGELRAETEKVIEQHGLQGQVTLSGWQTADQVQLKMQQADVFLMTSHRGEGWGIVVNEAMSNGCTPIVNRFVGAAPWMIEHGKTGFIYDDIQIDKLLDQLSLLTRKDLLKIGQAAYQSVCNSWSCAVAAERFVQLAEKLLQNQANEAAALFENGPCSMT